MRQHRLGYGLVVTDEIEFGESGAGIDDPVAMSDLDPRRGGTINALQRHAYLCRHGLAANILRGLVSAQRKIGCMPDVTVGCRVGVLHFGH